MSDTKITMLAIRYLSQVCEAITMELRNGNIENAVSATHCILGAAAHINKIAQNDYEGKSDRERVLYLRQALHWLIVLVTVPDGILSRCAMPVPSEREVRALHIATMGRNFD